MHVSTGSCFQPCTLKVLPLAVFLSFSSASGRALRSTAELLNRDEGTRAADWTYLGGSLPFFFSF